MVKLIAIDMDGTLLTPNHEITPRTVNAIHQAQRQGIEVIIATGRAYYEANDVIRAYGLELPFINLNGAQIRNKKHEVIETFALTQTQIEAANDVFNSEELFYQIYTDRAIYTADLNKELEIYVELAENSGKKANIEKIKSFMNTRIENGTLVEVDDYKKVFKNSDEIILKFLVKSSTQAKLNRAVNDLREIEDLAVSSSNIGNLEITHTHAQKGYALEAVAKRLNIDMKDTMAIGDNLNDVSMIKRASIGVAMENATSDVKGIAQKVTKSNYEDGVALAIEEVLGE